MIATVCTTLPELISLREITVKPVVNIVLALLVTATPVFAQTSPQTSQSESRPTDESLRQLLEITDAKKLVEGLPLQVDAMMTATLKQRLHGQTLSPQQQWAIDSLRAKVAALMKEDLAWSVMEPLYLKLYADSFSQLEINGMMDFYRSPAGHAVIQKLPLVMQNTMTMMQQRMTILVPKIQQMAQETAAEISAQKTAGKTS
jgi:hypothetical protein